jgi:hypothetical protein
MIETVANPLAPNPALEATDDSLLLQYRSATSADITLQVTLGQRKPIALDQLGG